MGHLMTHKFLDNLICNSQASCTNVSLTLHIYTQNINYHPLTSVQPACNCGEKISIFLSFITVTKIIIDNTSTHHILYLLKL